MFIYLINARKLIKGLLVIILAASIFISGFSIASAIKENNLIISTSAKQERVIIIDAGHGGEDSGAVGINGVYEKDLNLEIALLIGEELKNRGYTVVYTRTEDKMLYSPEENIRGMRKISDLKNRCKIASEYDDAILVSVHMNAFGSSKYSGLQVYYADKDVNSRLLAEKIQTKVANEIQTSNTRQVKNGKSLFILDNSEATSVIIECGFLSNADECEKLSQKEYQKQLSFSIVCGIIEYIDEIEPD